MNLAVTEILAIIASFLGSIFSVISLWRKKRAESEFEKILKERKTIIEKLIRTSATELINTKSQLSVEELKKLQLFLSDLINELDKSEREEILESLEQKSLKGQVNYLNKLIHLSGSDETITLKTP